MNKPQLQSHRPEQPPVPEFFMPAMPPLALTESLDRWYRRWLQRRRFRQLLELNDQNLEMLGLAREELIWAAGRPLREDAFEALREHRGRAA